MQKLIKKLLSSHKPTQKTLANLKRQYAKKTGHFLKNSEILKVYKKLVLDKKIKPLKGIENLLRLKKVRSLSGIVPIAVLTKPYLCPGKCVYCPTQKNMPKSYLSDEPAVMRAKDANFDSYLQVQRRIKQLQETGHSTEKIELIVMGGTFSSLPHDYQIDFMGKCFAAANDLLYPKDTLKTINLLEQQKINETSKNRIIGITLETRPDKINTDEIKHVRRLGATRVEIGIQSVYDDVLKKVKRGHTVSQTIKATKLLKDAGFKVCYHIMPNLPGSSLKMDFKMFKTIFTDLRFMPDMIKIYPCVVTCQAEIINWFKKGKYKPYSDKQLIDLLIKIKRIVPPWVRIMRLGRDIPIANIAAGFKISNIRQVLQAKMKQLNKKCQCIRCREAKNKKAENLKLDIKNYQASNGKEYFLQYIDEKNFLYALLRLRIPSQIFSQKKHFIPELQNTAIIRELHTYGKAIPINKKDKKAVQHIGLGKKLILKAEQITKKHGMKRLAVISGIGTREYYRKLGFKLKKLYMIKNFQV